jgi:uncharacterized protein YjdB
MSIGPTEDLSAEYEDAYDDAEGYDDSEGYDDAESSASRLRRRRALALAARRRAAARRASTLPATAPPRAVVSAVKELDLQSQVQQDTLRSVLAAQNRKQDLSNLATVGTLLIGEGFRAFGAPDNTFLRVAIEASPLALLPLGQRRSGVEGVLRRPVVYGGAAALGLALIADQRKRSSQVHTINILGPSQLTVGKEDAFIADVLDSRGRPSTVAVTWTSDNSAVASIDATGHVRAGTSAGVAIITATAGDVVRRLRLEVVAAQLTPNTTK